MRVRLAQEAGKRRRVEATWPCRPDLPAPDAMQLLIPLKTTVPLPEASAPFYHGNVKSLKMPDLLSRRWVWSGVPSARTTPLPFEEAKKVDPVGCYTDRHINGHSHFSSGFYENRVHEMENDAIW